MCVQAYKYIDMYIPFNQRHQSLISIFREGKIYGQVSSFQTLFPIINLLQPVIVSECLDMHVCIIIIMGTDITSAQAGACKCLSP